ncbi:hypothetical protein [uncultured Psychroserpens sp.]|uniref:hypothetical protein n=1 Tax=uncultured Psychroserpens sp. TaxID=255436 RepID=UPI002631DF67|nr:hypothetical protein [uncultured Psychroserpens sp.]
MKSILLGLPLFFLTLNFTSTDTENKGVEIIDTDQATLSVRSTSACNEFYDILAAQAETDLVNNMVWALDNGFGNDEFVTDTIWWAYESTMSDIKAQRKAYCK